MCKLCERSYQQTLGMDIWTMIVWAVNRARLFERKRQKGIL